jgi:hypothetical protein
MADEVTREFLLEQFRENRRLHGRTADRLDRMERRLDALDIHVGALVKGDLERNVEMSSIERYIRRIETRLDLREADA